MPTRARRYFRFAGFEMDRDALEIKKDGMRVPLQVQPFRVLEVLVEKAGMAVTREELRERVWPANVFIDFDHGLNNAVARLREALGDEADSPRFIETLPRVGYRFVFPADDIESGSGDAVVVPASGRAARRSRWPVLAVAAVAIALAALFAGLVGRHLWVAPQITSVAVLPVRDLSVPPDAAYLGEGITEALVTRLAQHPRLRVVSRRSADRYRGSGATTADIADELGVDGIIEGTYLRQGEQLRVDLRLLRASDESYEWAESYSIRVGDIFGFQEQVGSDLARALGGGPSAQPSISVARSDDLSAYELYLQGRHLFNQRNREAVTKSLDYFQQAIKRDPGFAAAYAGLAESYATLGGLTLVKSVSAEAVRDDALSAAQRALALDERLAESHSAMGQVLDKLYPRSAERDMEIEAHYRRAIELNPAYSTAYLWLGNFMYARGRGEEAIGEFRRAVSYDPVSPNFLSRLGAALLDYGETAEGLALLQRSIEIEPFQFNGRLRMGWALASVGRLDDAEASFGVAEQITPRSHHALAGLAFVAATKGDKAEALALLAEFEPVADKLDTPFLPAVVYVALGDNARALAWLERTATSSNVLVRRGPFNLDQPLYDGLRDDPAFGRIREAARSAAGIQAP